MTMIVGMMTMTVGMMIMTVSMMTMAAGMMTTTAGMGQLCETRKRQTPGPVFSKTLRIHNSSFP